MPALLLEQIEELTAQLSFEEQLSLLEHLAQQLRHRKPLNSVIFVSQGQGQKRQPLFS